jgi:hypothetical protein
MAGQVRCWVWKCGAWRPATRLEPILGMSLVRVLIDGYRPAELVHRADVRDTQPWQGGDHDQP